MTQCRCDITCTVQYRSSQNWTNPAPAQIETAGTKILYRRLWLEDDDDVCRDGAAVLVAFLLPPGVGVAGDAPDDVVDLNESCTAILPFGTPFSGISIRSVSGLL